MKKIKLAMATFVCCTSFSGIQAQALKLDSDRLTIQKTIYLQNLQSRDALAVVTNGSTEIMGQENDLIWAGYYQDQPNNPRIFGLTSVGSPVGWSPCFSVRADGKVGIMNNYPSVALEIGSASQLQQVKVNGSIVWGSDARMKENVRTMSGSLESLSKLRSVAYQLKAEPVENRIPDKIIENGLLSPEKAKAYTSEMVDSSNPAFESRDVYGFVAQELQELFPNLVFEDEKTGLLSVDYIGLIPILVNGLQEQQAQINEQQTEISELKKQQGMILELLAEGGIQNELSTAGTQSVSILRQNTPNPFTQSTEIGFYIPQSVTAANLYIYDYTGVRQKSIVINDREEGVITLDAGSLGSGIYFYTLICDGQPVDTKQMILTR